MSLFVGTGGASGPERNGAGTGGSAAGGDAAVGAREPIRRSLARAAERLRRRGLAVPEPEGKLLRPRFAYLAVPEERRYELGDRFWSGALAVQMVHEASLIHDDILESAPERRDRPTLLARRGLQAALVQGDRYLTSSYRAAAATGSPDYLRAFVEAVDRTVEGEIAQGRSAGRVLEMAAYRAVVEAKSGALFGAALTLGPALLGAESPGGMRSLGVRIGRLYQMVDDLLDYCPVPERGKPPFQDFEQRKWTHVLDGVPTPFERSRSEVLSLLRAAGTAGAASPLERALERIEDEVACLSREVGRLLPDAPELGVALDGWLERARAGVAAQGRSATARRAPGTDAGTPTGFDPGGAADDGTPPEIPEADPLAEVAEMARSLGGPESWPRLFARHSRSFRFASLLFPAEARRRVTGIYVYCRFTDDLVDRARDASPARLRRRLEGWRTLTRRAYDAGDTGVPLLDRVLGDAARRGIAFRHVSDLLDGVAMDVEPGTYPDLAALRTYTYGVAGTVGGWVAESFDARSADALARAHALGRGMQLTNILRDVGEDLRAGRLYLPLDRMDAHGVGRRELERAAFGEAPPPPGLPALLEELMTVAEEEYARGLVGLDHLPPAARIPVAVAARVYRGIHREIRKNDYDVLHRRAHTSTPRKVVLAGAALAALAVRLPRSAPPLTLAAPGAAPATPDDYEDLP